MSTHSDPASQLFVVERYDNTGAPGRLQPFLAPPVDVAVVCAVRIRADEVMLALVEGTDEQSTCAALAAAGWRIDRIVPASWMPPAEEVAS